MAFLVWNPWAIPAILVLVVCGGMGIFVFAARPDRVQNRRLALQLWLEALVLFCFTGGTYLMAERAAALALIGVGYAAVWPKLWTYYNFLMTLPTPMARFLNVPWRRFTFLALTLVGSASYFLARDFYVGGAVPHADGGWITLPGIGFNVMMNAWAVMWLVGLTFSISAYRRAKTETTRAQSRSYMIAFGFRDVLFQVVVLGIIFYAAAPWFPYFFLLFPLTWTIYPLLVGYGILRHQLFDIDVKVRFTIKQGTLVAVALGLFFLLSELLENLISDALGQSISVVAAVVLAYASKPVTRLAERVAHVVVPEQDPTLRREEVYSAAVEGALHDGRMTGTEQHVLRRLQEELGLSPHRASALEEQVRKALAA